MDKQSRKALKEQYKNRPLIGGIYGVRCNTNLCIRATADMQGSKNRFAFLISINSCPETSMMDAWNQYGSSAFSFEILEEIQKKETQTELEFLDDINTLLELWNEKSKSE